MPATINTDKIDIDQFKLMTPPVGSGYATCSRAPAPPKKPKGDAVSNPIEIALPEIDESTLCVQVDGIVMMITADLVRPIAGSKRFRMAVKLPEKLREGEVSAYLDNNVLRVVLEKGAG